MASNSETLIGNEEARDVLMIRPSLATFDGATSTATRGTASLPLAKDTPRVRPAGFLTNAARQELAALVQHLFLTPERPSRFVVFSGIQGAQTSRLTAAIADLLASETGAKVCLMDANRSQPAAHTSFALNGHSGLQQCVAAADTPGRHLHQVAENLWVLPWGPAGAGLPPERTIDGLQRIVVELSGKFDFLLLSCANADVFDDALRLGVLAQGVVLVLRNNVTTTMAAIRTRDRILQAGVDLLGAVLQTSI